MSPQFPADNEEPPKNFEEPPTTNIEEPPSAFKEGAKEKGREASSNEEEMPLSDDTGVGKVYSKNEETDQATALKVAASENKADRLPLVSICSYFIFRMHSIGMS
jgi:hypothetical protein